MIRPLSAISLLAAAIWFACPANSEAQPNEIKPTRRILALGGGGFRGSNNAVPKYFLALTGKKNPIVYYLPTAIGDSDRWIVEWYDQMNELECR